MVSVDETGTQVTASVMFAVMVPLLLLTVQFCPAGCVTGVTPYDAPLAYFVANVRVVLVVNVSVSPSLSCNSKDPEVSPVTEALMV